jgi:DNA-binding CsgD family transcriptional regulator
VSVLNSRDYRCLLELASSVLESSDDISWPRIAGAVRERVGGYRTAIFYGRDWFDKPPEDYPLPSHARDNSWEGLDDAIEAHPLLAYVAADTRDETRPVVGTTDDLPQHRRLPADEMLRQELEYLGSRHLAVAMPAPPGSRRTMVMGLTQPLRRRERELCEALSPLLAAIALHERRLDLLKQSRTRIGPKPEQRAREHGITPRELVVLRLLAQALTADAMARRLGLSPGTVHKHVQSLYRKLRTNDRVATVIRAQNLGLLQSHATHLAP